MAAIWNDIELEWDDAVITVTPSFEFINKLEQKRGGSLSVLIDRIQNNDLPLGMACHVVAVTLREGGVNVTDEEVFSKVFEMKTSLGALAGAIVGACLPMPKGSKAKEGK